MPKNNLSAIVVSVVLATAAFLLGFGTENLLNNDKKQYIVSTQPAASTFNASQPKNIWILPLLGRNTQIENINKKHLKKVIETGLEWFKEASGGQKIFTPTLVMQPKTIKINKNPCKEIESITAEESKIIPAETVLLAIVEDSIICDYGGLASVKGNWAIIMGWKTEDNTISRHVLVHELGHVLGLPHAQRYDCPILTTERAATTTNCELIEYGDKTDPMGRPPHDIVPNFNAIHLDQLNWGNGKRSIEEPGIHNIFLYPAAHKKRTKNNPPDYYLVGNIAISYRGEDATNPENLDNQLINKTTKNYEGIYLHKVEETDDSNMLQTTLLPFGKIEIAGKQGFHYISEQQDIAVYIKNILPQGKGAEVTVIKAKMGEKIGDIWGPVLKINKKKKYTNPVLIAWTGMDPSGISHYDIGYNGKRKLVPADETRLLYLKRKNKPQTITIKAYDMLGNETVETVTIEKRNNY